ncbi:biliverdin-producing heme oxygenase [Paramagnetospirillum marisnigri]|uniref:biliverdin-producing heme oxygenase n=1 Tax=Paramagnetospirillum marisnigri TaxID=1285242 RepID=UPI0012E77CCC|nr:biliverdin-producing heme oxygenase [Paramagnetospirillum marisnigri]
MRLFAKDYRRDELITLFGCLLAIHEPLEAALAGTPEAMAIGYRSRTPLLVNGLATLGGQRGSSPPVLVPTYSSSASRIGGLYVLEGSILGGQVIRRQLEAHFGNAIRDALDFYSPYGEDVGGQWIRFRTALAQITADEAAGREAELAAIATFSAIGLQLACLDTMDTTYRHSGSGS